ncbi:MAG: outer membrane beta-barrel protein [Bacteroidales bacterium]|nr:outer membrane beta-barrel protein [Bacteroidales bacterium]
MKRVICLLCLLPLFMAVAEAQPEGRPNPSGGRPSGMPKERNASSGREQASSRNLTGECKLRGVLEDSESGEPLEYANVGLLFLKDSAFLKATVTDEKGTFEMTRLPEGEFLLRATSVGYEPLYLPVTVKNLVSLGKIRMRPVSSNLTEVTVTADRPIYSVDGEKTLYNVSEDPSIQTGTTMDALQNAPGVEVDIEGNVTLRGISSVEIWINDKPSKLTAENLKTYLEILPANTLERIETITNPSAKYDTDAEAIINIVTTAKIKRNHFISFGLNGSSQPSVSPWFSYVLANDKWSVSFYESLRYSYRENASDGYAIQRKNDSLGGYDTIQREDFTSASENKNWSSYTSLNVNYIIDSMSDINSSLSLNYNGSSSYSLRSELRDNQFTGGDLYEYFTRNEGGSRNVSGMLHTTYSRRFDNKGHNMRWNLIGSLSDNHSDNNYLRDYTIYNDLDQNKYNVLDAGGGNFSLSGNYNRPISSDRELSVGANYSYDTYRIVSERLIWDSTSGGYTLQDTLRSCISETANHQVGANANWTRRWGSFTMQAGLGVNYSLKNLAYENACYPDVRKVGFFTARPTLHLSYRTKSMHTFRASYSLRMNNPSSSQLSLYRDYGEDSYSTGNPSLKSYHTHNAEMGWTKYFNRFGSVGVEGYGRYSTREISSISDVTDEVDPYIGRMVQFTMPYNMGSTYRYGTSFNATYRPTGFFNLRFYANVYHAVYEMDYPKTGRVRTVSDAYSLRLNAWAKLFNQYQLHASARYSSPSKSLFSESKATYSLNAGLRSDFFNRKMSVFVNVQDIFNWGKKRGSGSGSTNPYYISYSNQKVMNSRYISAGLTFRFGKMELEKNASSGEGDSE